MQSTIDTDVVIAGGGSAGVAAAIGAASMGVGVVLIEQHPFLGGKATAAEVGTVCGLYGFTKSETPQFIVKGFAKKFALQLQKDSNSIALHNRKGLHFLPYSINTFKKICTQLLAENKVKVLVDATVVEASAAKGNINYIKIHQQKKVVQISTKAIVDSTGQSAISIAAALPVLSNEQYQAAAQVFTLQNVAASNEALLGMILIKELQLAIQNQLLSPYFDRVYIVEGSLKNNTVSLKIGIPVPVTNGVENPIALKNAAHLFIQTLTTFLSTHVAAFKNASLQSIAPEVGTRVGVRSIGKYILTEKDVLECRKFADGIANASWPIEEWVQDKRVKMQYLPENDFYQIPIGCLQSNAIDNLFFAGRTISATDKAIASARVMGICLQTGYAAGMLAAARALGIPQKQVLQSIQNAQL